MAVTIDELQVEVQDRAAAAQPPSKDAQGQRPVDLRCALAMQRERELRLKAD